MAIIVERAPIVVPVPQPVGPIAGIPRIQKFLGRLLQPREDGGLFALLTALATEIERANTDVQTLTTYLDVKTSVDEWADRWGEFYSVPRRDDELDEIYTSRILTEVLGRKTTVAVILAAIEEHTGFPATIAEHRTNGLANPSFEEGTVGALPTGWTKVGANSAATKEVTTVGEELFGLHEVQLVIGAPDLSVALQQTVEMPQLRVDDEIGFTIFLRTSANVSVELKLYEGTSGNPLAIASEVPLSIVGGADWVQVSVSRRITQGTSDRVTAEVVLLTGSVTLRADGARVTPYTIESYRQDVLTGLYPFEFLCTVPIQVEIRATTDTFVFDDASLIFGEEGNAAYVKDLPGILNLEVAYVVDDRSPTFGARATKREVKNIVDRLKAAGTKPIIIFEE